MSPKHKLSRVLPAALVVAALAVAWLYRQPAEPVNAGAAAAEGGAATVRQAFESRRSGQMVEVDGRVVRLLADDREGSRHQRFILEIEDGTSLLVAHNIDLAPRVPLSTGDRARVRGQYEWNDRGGVLHWTHHDPDGSRRDTGWIEHEGRVYE